MTKSTALGLKENWQQFALLVIVNAFVGGMIGLERSIFPQFAEQVFGITSASSILSFIVAFGFTKAATNYFTGRWANRFGRKRLLVIGWMIAIPIPLILIFATSWNHVVIANVLLGINQGLTWSTTVIMKIDLVGPKHRGFAMGLNEFAGYLAVGLVALGTGYLAELYGVTPYPFYLGLTIALTGLFLSLFFVRDTMQHVELEAKSMAAASQNNVFLTTSLFDKTLSSITQAGLVNNLNDGMIWGLFPILLLGLGYDDASIGWLVALYPGVWGVGQLATGKMADHYSKKSMLVVGMLIQSIAIFGIAISTSYFPLVVCSVSLGLGTALVYPTFLAAIADATLPNERAESIGVFRLWRDSGYAIGALMSGIIADSFGLLSAISVIGFLTVMSALVIQFRMPNN